MVRDANYVDGTNGATLADEKVENNAIHHENGTLDEMGPDPDAGLSEEERAKIVHMSKSVGKRPRDLHNTTGQGASAKARFQTNTMGLYCQGSRMCTELTFTTVILSISHLFP
jgi:hypothetical protein